MELYVNDPCPAPSLSSGVLNTLTSRSAAHARIEQPQLSPSDDEDAGPRADLGSAAHSLIVGGNRIAWVPADNWRTNAAKEKRDEARLLGAIPLLSKQRPQVEAIATSARALLTEEGYGDFTETERTLIWREGDLWARGRPDLIVESRSTVIDVKTTTNANPGAWIMSTLFKAGYYLQAAWYLRGLHKLRGGKGRDFLFLAVEIDPPYACSFVSLMPGAVEFADRRIERGLRLWRQCLETGRWPAYDRRIHYADLPTYMALEEP
jgi:hypothetical protein